MPQEKRVVIPILLFIGISLYISLTTLFRESLRLDEAQSLWLATKSLPGIVSYLSTDVHVPLYELMLHFWLQIFGATVVSARLLSFIFFIASLPFLFLVAWQSTNKRTALLATALYSLSPFIVWYSFEARMYTLLTLVACASHFFFLRMVRSNFRRGQVGYFFSIFFGLYTHYFFSLLVLSQIVFFGIYIVRGKPKGARTRDYAKESKRKIFYFLSPLTFAFILFLPWIIYFSISGFAANDQPLIPPSTAYNLFQTVVNFLFGFQTTIIQSILVSLWPLAVIPVFFLFTRKGAEETQLEEMTYFFIVTVFPIFFVFFVSYLRPIFLSRYLIFVTPSFFILMAWVLFQMSRHASSVILSFAAFVMFGFLLTQNISHDTPVKEDYKGVSNFLMQKASGGDIIAISSPFTIYPFEYYYKGNTPVTTIPAWDVYKSGTIPSFNQTSMVNQIKPYNKVYENIYLVLSYDQGYQKSIVFYMDTHYKRLLVKKFSPGLEVREYKLRYP
ncbi:MAG: glycosyltransferase family 39 protein [Candidatus Levyibacteriota bacterium]